MKFIVFVLSCFLRELVADIGANNFTNFCLDAKNHKRNPSPESDLFGECSPWKNRACCHRNTTIEVHRMNSYDLNFDHCAHVKVMSPQCQLHFKRDLCFYECEPNIGPWVIQVNKKKRKERFFKVPLCASECEKWYDDCKNDFTCAKNWIKDFKWNQNGTNECVQTCTSFADMYGSAKNFCESVWDDSWEYTTDDKPCMKIWFDSTNGNPNDAVFQDKMRSVTVIAAVPKASQSDSMRRTVILGILVIVVLILYYFARKKSLKPIWRR